MLIFSPIKNITWSLTILALVSQIIVSPVLAVTTPTFPSCANPQGTTKVSYSEGTHGIVGSGATYTGKDTVYTLTDDTLTQCFCSSDGQGIQTNWWKASALTENEINILKSEGWIYVPAGLLWGLADSPYVAKNTSYSCLPAQAGLPGAIGGVSDTVYDGIGGGEVLGLAATGDSILVYSSFLIGAILLLVGLRRLHHNS